MVSAIFALLNYFGRCWKGLGGCLELAAREPLRRDPQVRVDGAEVAAGSPRRARLLHLLGCRPAPVQPVHELLGGVVQRRWPRARLIDQALVEALGVPPMRLGAIRKTSKREALPFCLWGAGE